MKNNLLIKPAFPINDVGGKANNLVRLDQMKINVPQWVVIPQSVLLSQLPSELNELNVAAAFDRLIVPRDLLIEMKTFFGSEWRTKKYAVRSSAMDEDGSQFSFAGQYATHLNVAFDQLEDTIIKVWKSVCTEHVNAYRKQHGMEVQYGIAVIIQEMISPDVSGVAFGVDPVSGQTDSKTISAVYGLGEGLVSGTLKADNFFVQGKKIKRLIANKEFSFRCNPIQGIEKVALGSEKQKAQTLANHQLIEIDLLLEKLNDTLGAPQDIEFAYINGKLYLLQTRPVTTIPIHDLSKEGEYMLWDNSNIVESYPGITTPLTFSFISKMYNGVYTQLSSLMGVSNRVLLENKNVFLNTLGLVRGRVYYNLANWYKMLAMAPGFSINASFMETMMGVKEKFTLDGKYKMSKRKAWVRTIIMIIKMIFLQIRLPRTRKKFQNLLDHTLEKYDAIDYQECTPAQIVKHYKSFEHTLLGKWHAPLINDFFSMIWFGLLKNICQQSFPNEVNMHNDLLCGSQDIISVIPVRETLAIATRISNDASVKSLFKKHGPAAIWEQLRQEKYIEIKKVIDIFLNTYGERCVGELKLETISYSQDPVRYIKILKDYVENNVMDQVGKTNIENELRADAISKFDSFLKGKLFKSIWFNYVLRKARDLVSNRENLRFERTRAFGMVRKMFSALGYQLKELGILEDERDVFYLTLEEVMLLSTDEKLNIADLTHSRKAEFASYQLQAPPEERFYTYGKDFSDDYIYSKEKLEPITGDLNGIGCCPGVVKGKVRVISHPSEITSLDGDILVTTSTDPGWVTLFPSASGIIVERGSLLSHSAIVSREMGIPCIVSVDGLLRTLKTGDRIIMDGRNGTIKIVNH